MLLGNQFVYYGVPLYSSFRVGQFTLHGGGVLESKGEAQLVGM